MTKLAINKKYRQHINRKLVLITLISVLLILFMLMGVTLGSAKISLLEVFNTILNPGESDFSQIIFNIRLPRVLSAVMAGAALSVSGAVMQSLLRNPLASPVSLGISHAAAFGAAFAIVILGAGASYSHHSDAVIINNPYIVTISAFIWSAVSTSIILLIARYKNASPETIILSGIVCGSLFTAGISALQYFADDIQLASIVFWLFGDLGKADWHDFTILVAVIVPILIYFIRNRWNYNAMNAGDETATSVGVNVSRVRIIGMLAASLAISIAISFFGVIGFVGLVVPHIVKRLIGNDERFLIPASALFGGLFLLLSDTIARTIISPVVLPVGIVTSFIGAPIFIYLLIKGIKRY